MNDRPELNQRTLAPADRRVAVDQIIAGFRDSMRDLRCLGSERLLRQGISMSHLHAMTLLEAHGPTSMTKLADHVGASLSNATGLVDRMEERGLVERFRMPGDRRVVLVRIADHGRRVLGEFETIRHDLFGRILERLEDHQIAVLAVAARDFRAAVTAHLGSDSEVGSHAHSHAHPAAHAPVGAPAREPDREALPTT